MTYKEALLFVGKCLTIGIYSNKVPEVLQEIRTGKIVWEQIVRLSSSHLVLPALFIRLEKANLLNELPVELIGYMEYLTRCNRERNQQIIQQVQDIASLLNSNGFEPILLKGTAHLLLPFYEDLGERMVGDIDFLVEERNIENVARLLIESGYQPLGKFNIELMKSSKHYPRLTNFNYPAAVEIHRQVIVPPHDKKFKSSEIIREKQKAGFQGEVYIPSAQHLIIHNVLNTQVNDQAYLKGDINLRQMSDLLLLSQLENPQSLLKDSGLFPQQINAYLAATSMVFEKPVSIEFHHNRSLMFSLKRYNFFIAHPKCQHIYKSIIYISYRLSRYVILPIQAVCMKDVRACLWFRISDPKWYKNHVLSY